MTSRIAEVQYRKDWSRLEKRSSGELAPQACYIDESLRPFKASAASCFQQGGSGGRYRGYGRKKIVR